VTQYKRGRLGTKRYWEVWGAAPGCTLTCLSQRKTEKRIIESAVDLYWHFRETGEVAHMEVRDPSGLIIMRLTANGGNDATPNPSDSDSMDVDDA
jgi:hypothetical protein